MKSPRTLSSRQRAATICSPPVSSVVSPNTSVQPASYSLSKALPTVGLDPQPDVVSDSPHLHDTHRSARSHSSRCFSLAHCRYPLAAFDARMMVSWSPCSSIPKPVTGFPVAAMPSTTLLVHPSSIPMTTTAATLGLLPAPINVRK